MMALSIMNVALSNFDTSMLPRIGYAVLLSLALIGAAAVANWIYEIGKAHIRRYIRRNHK